MKKNIQIIKMIVVLCLMASTSLFLACDKKIDTSSYRQPGGGGDFNPNPGESDSPFGGTQTGAQIKLAFPIDEADENLNGLLLEGIEGAKTTLSVTFIPGVEQLPGGDQGEPTELTDLIVTATDDFGGLTMVPFITEDDMENDETFRLVTTPEGPHNQTRVILITARAKDSGGADILTTAYLLVNTSVILTTGPEYVSVSTITGPDVNPLTNDTITLKVLTTTNLDQMVTGIGELVDDPPGRFAPEDLPFYVPIFGNTVLGGGVNPKLFTFPIDYEFPKGTVSDLPGQRVYMRNFCLSSEVTPDLQTFVGQIECVTGEQTTSETSGLPGLLFDVEGFVQGNGITEVLPTDPARGLTLSTIQVTTATDLDESTIDTVSLEIFESTTQPDLSLAGKIRVVYNDQVNPNEPPVIVPFSTEPMDLVNLRTVSNPVSLRLPVGMLSDLGFEVESRNVRLLLNVTEDFLFTYSVVLPGGVASTALGDNVIEGTSFSKSLDYPVGPKDPLADIDFDQLWVLAETGNGTNLKVNFTPGTNAGAESTVASATLFAFGSQTDLVELDQTVLTADDFQNNIATIPVHIADNVALETTTIIPFKIEGTDSDGVAFKGYGGLTLKRIGPQPPLPIPADLDLIQLATRPDVILSTPNYSTYRTVVNAIDYGGPNEILISGTSILVDPPGIDFSIPVNSTFNTKTLAVFTDPITIEVPQGVSTDTEGVAGIVISNLAFEGFYSEDLKVASMEMIPGAIVELPNGVQQAVEGFSGLQIADRTPPEGRPDILMTFTPNPLIYNVSPGNQSELVLEFVPGEDEFGQPTILDQITCFADHDFGVLTVDNFSSVDDFVNGFASYTVIPPEDYNPQDGDQIFVQCQVFDSEGQKGSWATTLIVSNSYFQTPTNLPNFIFDSFNTDPEINSNTPPAGFFGPYPGDGVRFKIIHQKQIPGLFAAIATGDSKLTHYTKTDSLEPPEARWKSYQGPEFILPFTGTLDLKELVLITNPIGGPGGCNLGDSGLMPGGQICFPAGEAQEDVMLNGNPTNLIIPMRNFALFSHFAPDLRSFTGTSALSCSGRLACNGSQFCPYPNNNFLEPCGPNDDNPNPFGLASSVEGLPAISIPMPLNSFGTGQLQ